LEGERDQITIDFAERNKKNERKNIVHNENACSTEYY